jgi:hypothetical protein
MIRKSSEHVGEPSAEINILEPADGNTAQCSLGAAVEAIGNGLCKPLRVGSKAAQSRPPTMWCGGG